MMTNTKKSKKSKKSTSKKRTYKISPLIPIVAVIEVLVLIGVATYAWYYVAANKVIDTGTISVAADSGLDIDFKYSNVDDYINIWNYVGTDFKFEPATSMDGRMIYFPTSGTFAETDTRQIVLRDGTVNDINSKYLSIDFELTNNSGYDQYVYLNNKSRFEVVDKADDNLRAESRALRLAFYANDGNSGNVGSSLLTASGSTDGSVIEKDSEDSSLFTVYFDSSSAGWGNSPNPYAYFYNEDDEDISPEYYAAWPGSQMARVSGSTYSISFENPVVYVATEDEEVDDEKTYYTLSGGVYTPVETPVDDDLESYYESTGHLKYEKLIFSNNGGSQSSTFTLTPSSDGHEFSKTADAGAYSENTVYLVKPDNWGDNVKCYTWKIGDNADTPYTPKPGDDMTYVGSGIYAYSYDSTNTGGMLFNDGEMSGTRQTNNVTDFEDGALYYYTGTSSGHYTVSKYGTAYSNLTYRTVYLYNSFGWEIPYATVSVGSAENTQAKAHIPMTALSGNVYYCKVPSIYDYIHFRMKSSDSGTNRSSHVAITDQTVYRPIEDITESGNRDTETFIYADYIQSEGYPVISPGVSAGFQRPYSPVLEIEQYSGLANKIIPAYSYSIDNYILGSGTPLFILKAGHMISLSMIMWLEGTDEACTGEAYAGNKIDLRLEFSTLYYNYPDPEHPTTPSENIVNPGDSASYTYKFYDKTREIWTSNRKETESGVTVAPVMQLYDNTIKRGYLMKASEYTSFNGKQKVSCWSVSAPQSIAVLGHDIVFRRVNPYNEDEVWNYWYAGRVAGDDDDPVYRNREEANGDSYTVYDIARSGTDTICFTAFADGSPTTDNLTNAYLNTHAVDPANPTSAERTAAAAAATAAAVPVKSCGGLWGNHSVRTVTVLDGLYAQPLKDDKGIISVNYSFNYQTDGVNTRTVNIEYKASGSYYDALYYIIMPSIAYTEELTCTFKHYTKFEDAYAINSNLNDKITFKGTYGDNQTITGEYFELSRDTTGRDYSYWGSDLLVVQNSGETQDYYLTGEDKDRLTQAHFYAVEAEDLDEEDVNTGEYNEGDKYGYMYYNPKFNSNDGTGFAVVVPNDKQYYMYAVELCDYNGDTVFHMTDYQPLSNTSLTVTDAAGETCDLNVNYTYNTSGDYNILKLDYITVRIYLQTGFQSSNKDPRIYSFNSSGGATSWDYRPTMTALPSPEGFVDGVGWKYYYDVRVSLYGKVKFTFPALENNNNTVESNEVDISRTNLQSGEIFQSDGKVNGNPWVWDLKEGNDGNNVRQAGSTNNDTSVLYYTDAKWPHFTVKTAP